MYLPIWLLIYAKKLIIKWRLEAKLYTKLQLEKCRDFIYLMANDLVLSVEYNKFNNMIL